MNDPARRNSDEKAAEEQASAVIPLLSQSEVCGRHAEEVNNRTRNDPEALPELRISSRLVWAEIAGQEEV
jgi:hypothetical protein